MTEKQTIYIFSDFRIDTVNKTLRRNEIIVPLTPKVFDTLVILLENAPNLVEKNVLMDKLWHNQFVEESNITFNIKMLRKALDDDATSPTFIETVPRRGYRFIAELKKNQPDLEKLHIQTFKPRYLFGLLALIAFASLIAVTSQAWKSDANNLNAPIFSSKFKSTKLTDTGKANHAIISPDGNYIVYTNEVSGKQSLWLRQLSGGINTEILQSSDENYFGLAFSNDSETIFFVRKPEIAGSRPSIYKIPLIGGIPDKIAENSEGKISISPDNKQIIFIRYEQGFSDQNNLMLVDIDSKKERILKVSDAPDVFWSSAFAPDSKKIIASYGSSNNASKNMKLVEIDLVTGEQTELSKTGFFQIGDLVWLENQSGFIFTATETLGESGRIWMYNNQNIEPLTKDTTDYVKISLNKNADKLVSTTLTADFGLFIGSNPNFNRYLTQARDGFSFSSDGKIVYAGDAAGSEDIWIMDENGSNQKQLTNNKSLDAYPLVSIDNQIYFASNRSGENQIWQMNLDGTNQIQLTKKSGGKPIFATPDGKWIYYSSATDQFVWKVSTKDNQESKLFPQKTGFYQAFSPDGLQMAYLLRNKETNKFEIAVISVETQKIIKQFSIPEGKSHPYFLHWTSDAKGLTYSLEDANGDKLLWLQDLTETAPKSLFNLGNDELMDCKLSPDGKNYIFIRGKWKHDAVLLSGLK